MSSRSQLEGGMKGGRGEDQMVGGAVVNTGAARKACNAGEDTERGGRAAP